MKKWGDYLKTKREIKENLELSLSFYIGDNFIIRDDDGMLTIKFIYGFLFKLSQLKEAIEIINLDNIHLSYNGEYLIDIINDDPERVDEIVVYDHNHRFVVHYKPNVYDIFKECVINGYNDWGRYNI